MYIDLLSVLKGISGMLAKAPENPYTDCAKEQLDSVIEGFQTKENVAPTSSVSLSETSVVEGEKDLDIDATQAREELMG